MPGCVAYGCTNRSEGGYSMRRFPSDPSRRAIWVAALKRENWSPSQSSRLCEVHFEPDQFEKPDVEGKIKLKNNAVPTIFMHKKTQTKRPAPKVRAPLPKKQKMDLRMSEIKIEEKEDDEQPDDSERVIQLKIKIKKLIAENRRLRTQLENSRNSFSCSTE